MLFVVAVQDFSSVEWLGAGGARKHDGVMVGRGEDGEIKMRRRKPYISVRVASHVVADSNYGYR